MVHHRFSVPTLDACSSGHCGNDKPMSDFQSEMNRAVSNFVAQVTELARDAARDMIDQALGGKRKLGLAQAFAGFGRRVKRSSDDIDSLADSVHAFLVKKPGLRIEQINKQLGTTTKALALPIRKLVADGAIKTKGQKRSTTYFAVDKKN